MTGSTTSSTSAAITAPPPNTEPPGPKPSRPGPRSPAWPLGHKPSWDRPSCALSRPEPIKLTVPRRLPKTEPQRDAYVAQVGADGFLLLDTIDAADAPPAIAALPAVAVLGRVWARHFERAEAGPDKGEISGDAVRLRPAHRVPLRQ